MVSVYDYPADIPEYLGFLNTMSDGGFWTIVTYGLIGFWVIRSRDDMLTGIVLGGLSATVLSAFLFAFGLVNGVTLVSGRTVLLSGSVLIIGVIGMLLDQ